MLSHLCSVLWLIWFLLLNPWNSFHSECYFRILLFDWSEITSLIINFSSWTNRKGVLLSGLSWKSQKQKPIQTKLKAKCFVEDCSLTARNQTETKLRFLWPFPALKRLGLYLSIPSHFCSFLPTWIDKIPKFKYGK